MHKILIRELVYRYGTKDLMKKTMYPEVIEEILNENNISLETLLEQSLGFNQQDVKNRGEQSPYKDIKNIVAVADLILEGMETYKVKGWKELCKGVKSNDPSHFNMVFIPYITKRMKVTSRNESIVTEDGKIFVSNRMVKKNNLNLLVACIHVKLLGLNFHRMYMKKTIEEMRLFKTLILKPVLDERLVLINTIAEYWGVTMNELMDWDYDPDELLGLHLMAVPSDNLGKVVIKDLKKLCGDIEIGASALEDIKYRGLLKEFSRREGEMYIGNTKLKEYWE